MENVMIGLVNKTDQSVCASGEKKILHTENC